MPQSVEMTQMCIDIDAFSHKDTPDLAYLFKYAQVC